MKVCASPSCSASAVSLAAALRAGWKFLAGRLYCGRCHQERLTGVTVERAREVLARYREELHSARIIALAEHEPDVFGELTDAERERPR